MKYELKILIEDNTELKILFDREEEFDDVVNTARRLENKYHFLSIRDSLNELWVTSEGSKILSNQIENTTHRLVICLLESYPASKSTSIIATEVGQAESTTSNNLSGRYGGAGNLFMRTDEGWTLSEEGLKYAITEILPAYTKK